MTEPAPQPPFANLGLLLDGPVAHLELRRPAKLNALSRDTLREIAAASQWLDGRPEVKVVVLSGAGRAFCAGFDLGDFAAAESDGVGPRESADLGRRAAEALTAVRATTVARLHGHVVGGGVVLAAACDLRVAADSTTFSIPEAELGIPLAWGGIPRLVREIGPARTRELVLTCRPFGADEAAAMGLLNRVVPEAALDGAVGELVGALVARPQAVLEATKQQVAAAAEALVPTTGAFADADLLVGALRDPEAREAARRYLAARQG